MSVLLREISRNLSSPRQMHWQNLYGPPGSLEVTAGFDCEYSELSLSSALAAPTQTQHARSRVGKADPVLPVASMEYKYSGFKYSGY